MWNQIDIVNDENSYTVATQKISHDLGPIRNVTNKTNAGYAYFLRIKTRYRIGYVTVIFKEFELTKFPYMHLQRSSIILCTMYNT